MKIGVLGGGLSGLVVAGHSRHECEVLELDSVPGGHCRSLVRDGYTIDLGGPHIMFSKNAEILGYMVEQLGENIVKMRRNNKIYFKGRYVKYPFENGLYDLTPEDRFECLYHYLKNEHPAPTNFKEWVYHTFGTGIAEKYMLPYNEKIWNLPAEQMSTDWVDGRIPRPPLEDVIKSAVGVETEGYTHQLYFSYPRSGGIESLVRAFERKCGTITTGFGVRSVRPAGDGGWLVGDGHREKRFDKLVSTIPIEDLVRALSNVPPEITACVERLRFNSLIVVMLGQPSDAPPPYTAVYVPDPSTLFHRISFPLNFTPEGAPPGHMAVSAEITTNPGDGIHELPDEAIYRQVIEGLERMQIVQPDRITFRHLHRTKHAYVVRTHAHADTLRQALEYVTSLGIKSVGRNAEFEYINMDEAIRRGLAAVAELDAA